MSDMPLPSPIETRRKRGRLDDSLAAPRVAVCALPSKVNGDTKRRRGAQPGNLNALKHGFYLNHARIRGTAPLKAADLDSVSSCIAAIREQIRRTGEANLDHATLEEVSEATRSLAFAGLALSRLIRIQQLLSSSYHGETNQGH